MGFSGIKAGKLMKKHSNIDFSTLQLSNYTQFISYDINKYVFFQNLYFSPYFDGFPSAKRLNVLIETLRCLSQNA